ncbi:DinB family protein [Maritalea sp.]|uniref:DinB family protein n=1 Tax=Maritalea sp. TaxID=2003361 RepID=UPI003EF2247B
MITLDYCRLMARYNIWQNNSLLTAADALEHHDRWKDRGAFFHSIAETLNHIYLADTLQLGRLMGNERPHEGLDLSHSNLSDWHTFKVSRSQRDEEIKNWAANLQASDLNTMIVWYSPNNSERFEKPTDFCAVQLFNHQTHHRGQVHAMLTAAGAKPEATDLSSPSF